MDKLCLVFSSWGPDDLYLKSRCMLHGKAWWPSNKNKTVWYRLLRVVVVLFLKFQLMQYINMSEDNLFPLIEIFYFEYAKVWELREEEKI